MISLQVTQVSYARWIHYQFYNARTVTQIMPLKNILYTSCNTALDHPIWKYSTKVLQGELATYLGIWCLNCSCYVLYNL